MSEKILIISPQAGMGNRFRAIASAMVLAKQIGRKIYHAWTPITANDGRVWIRPLQEQGFEGLFLPTNDLSVSTTENIPNIDVCFTEWSAGDYWYQFQSSAQSVWNNIPITHKSNNPADQIATSDSNVILLETSHAVRLSESFGGCKSDQEWENELSKAYSLLKPQPKFLSMISKIEKSDVGIAIRRGDLLNYFPEANQDIEAIRKWASELSKNNTVMVFSDDDSVRTDIACSIYVDEFMASNHPTSHTFDVDKKRRSCIFDSYEGIIKDLLIIESAFVQFLYLASRCTVICGTPCSSFAKEASLFGNKPYFNNLHNIEEITLKLKSHGTDRN